jgi:hypothetical protein
MSLSRNLNILECKTAVRAAFEGKGLFRSLSTRRELRCASSPFLVDRSGRPMLPAPLALLACPRTLGFAHARNDRCNDRSNSGTGPMKGMERRGILGRASLCHRSEWPGDPDRIRTCDPQLTEAITVTHVRDEYGLLHHVTELTRPAPRAPSGEGFANPRAGRSRRPGWIGTGTKMRLSENGTNRGFCRFVCCRCGEEREEK